MALVPIKTSMGTGFCDCICGCYALASQRDEGTGKGFCPRCAEQHLERNRELARRIPRPRRPVGGVASLPPGTIPPALQKRA